MKFEAWEYIKEADVYRMKVPNGWLVGVYVEGVLDSKWSQPRITSITFVPDKNHTWGDSRTYREKHGVGTGGR